MTKEHKEEDEKEEEKYVTPEKGILRRCPSKRAAEGAPFPSTPQGMLAAAKAYKGQGKPIPRDLAIALATAVKGMKGTGKGVKKDVDGKGPAEPVASSGWVQPRRRLEEHSGQPKGERAKEKEADEDSDVEMVVDERSKMTNATDTKMKTPKEAEMIEDSVDQDLHDADDTAAKDKSKKKKSQKRHW